MQVEALIGQLQDYATKTRLEGKNEDGRLREAAQQVADELIALQSIFGDENIALLAVQGGQSHSAVPETWRPQDAIRLSINIPLDLGEDDDVSMKLSATLPSGYPQTSTPPQLQLLSRYIGPHGVDHLLFVQVLRVYYHNDDAEDLSLFQRGEVCLYEGIERVRERVEGWYREREADVLQRRQADQSHAMPGQGDEEPVHHEHLEPLTLTFDSVERPREAQLKIYTSPAITERKSIFVGHAAVLTDVSQVPLILDDILKDKKVARASHPTINAWVCRPEAGGPVCRDCDDDGETAAGGRLAHLLDLLHLENVIVVVTRWYGGTHLGADRFKLINRAARDALEVAQLVSGPLNPERGRQHNGGIQRK